MGAGVLGERISTFMDFLQTGETRDDSLGRLWGFNKHVESSGGAKRNFVAAY